MGAFEDYVNANLGIRRPMITDSGNPNLSSKAGGIIGSNYRDSSNNQLYEKTGENNSTDWMPIGQIGHSRFSGESGIYMTMTGNSGFLQDEATIGTGNVTTFIVTNSGKVGINIEDPLYSFHVAGSSCLSGAHVVLNYDALPKNNPNTRGRVWVNNGSLMVSSG
tara:strand:+ start:50777 stop:51268 length:492 start_codon:yes stop_codon:yes gene_type:complete